MYYSEDIIEQVRSRVDIVDVVLGGVGYDIGVAGQSGKGSELGCPIVQAHVWVTCRFMVRQVDDVSINLTGIAFVHFAPHSALWPPTWPFRAMVVAPSIRFMPFSTAFLPNFFWSWRVAS